MDMPPSTNSVSASGSGIGIGGCRVCLGAGAPAIGREKSRSTGVGEPGERPKHGVEHALSDLPDVPRAGHVLDPIAGDELLGARVRLREALLEPVGIEQLLGAAA